ncbi:hypothetical protein HBH68_110330 [Parastagonospora nodorum]|nr:hypothetical protein HBH68_110330 [Parastagonospora nodorum]
MSDTSATSMGYSGSSDHEDCPFHDEPHQGLCYAITNQGNACKHPAKIYESGLLPVCTRHNYAADDYKNSRAELRAGLCQAISECGHTCNRLANYSNPYHFCGYHSNGSIHLPCHIMQLPTELRLMVFRYLFPEEVSNYRDHGVEVAILKANRQIHQEASSVLYGESYFETEVHPHSIKLQGKQWKRDPPAKSEDNYSLDSLLPGSSRLIRNLNIRLEVGEHLQTPRGIGSDGISLEDYMLYIFRDSVRKVVDHFTSHSTRTGSQNVLKKLKVSASVARDWSWSSEELVTVLFLIVEPLQLLSADCRFFTKPVSGGRHLFLQEPRQNSIYIANMQKRKAYPKLREQWLNVSKNPEASSVFRPQKPQPAVRSALTKLDALAQLLRMENKNNFQPWMASAFRDMARPLHLARVAYENDDLAMINRILEAIKLRWINANRKHQASIRTVKNSIAGMLESNTTYGQHDGDLQGEPSLAMLYPDEFGNLDLEQLRPVYDHLQPYLWLEISAEDSVPKRGDSGVEWKIEGVRVRARKGGREWVRLKTLEVVRQFRSM